MTRIVSALRHTVQIVILSTSLLWSACTVNETSPPDTSSTFSSIQLNIFSKNCTTSSCHSTLGQRGNLVLEGSAAYDNLVNVLSDNSAARLKGLMRVAPGKPDSSFLLIKLIAPRQDEGDLMPLGSLGLTAGEIESIRTWIANGAKRD